MGFFLQCCNPIFLIEIILTFVGYYRAVMPSLTTDILENDILRRWPEVLQTLLIDHTTHRNIIWATDMYVAKFGETYSFSNEILVEQITGDFGEVIKPRSVKPKEEQDFRVKDKAEVFTPSWICNAQNNLVDEAWFGRKNVFNTEINNEDGSRTWEPTTDPITFPEGKTWKDYVRDTRLEITCGEAPYLVSRYDTTTGDIIPVERRIGLLDRKLRVISENTTTTGEWLDAAQTAYQNIYGYEWQGDNLLLARENLLYTFIDFYTAKFSKEPMMKSVNYIAYIISWNLWQMDGLKFVVPGSCHNVESKNQDGQQLDMFSTDVPVQLSLKIMPCPGCAEDNMYKHNGHYCLIRDWHTKDKKKVRYIDLFKHQ